jgi:malate dehydrogenase
MPPFDYYNTRAMTSPFATVAIVGCGDLGGSSAQALATRDVAGRLLLIDAASDVAAGKALDIQQSGAVGGFHARLEGTDDLSRVIGCSVCVIADRFGAASSEWQGEDGLAMLRRLTPFVASAPIVFAGSSQAELMSIGAREIPFPRERLVGSAPEALISAIAAIVAIEARCAPGEVNITVLGTPPAGFVVPWSEATISGYSLDRVLSAVQVARIEARAARLWPLGPYALGAAAARVTQAILRSSARAFSVLTPLGGEFGVRDRAAALPCILGARGIVQVRTPVLNPRERVRLETALGA